MIRLTKDEIEAWTELEVLECECGYHMGVDSTYLEQVGDFVTDCPSCGITIDTAVIFPDNRA